MKNWFLSLNRSKWRFLFYGIIVIYALAGFFLTTVFFAIKLGLTRDPGTVDFNDRYFANVSRQEDSLKRGDSLNGMNEAYVFSRLALLSKHYPLNARQVLDVYYQSKNPFISVQMMDAAGLYLEQNQDYTKGLNAIRDEEIHPIETASDSSLYPWANTIEWRTLREAVIKDKAIIDSVAALTGISPRLITAMLIGEQIRLFDSKREAFKKWISPLKILVNETTLSLGVMGIKEETAIKIENYLKNAETPFYPGPEYAHLLDFRTSDLPTERFQRLTNPRNHTYPYLYCALYLKQIMNQWKHSGYDISGNVGILATLYNLGYPVSKPKPDPKVGGSRIMVNGIEYTFGRLAYEYYYSGEISEAYPL